MKGILSMAVAAACFLCLAISSARGVSAQSGSARAVSGPGVSVQPVSIQSVSIEPVSIQPKGGRYDAEIRAAVAQLLASKSECRNVKAAVDDGVVTLTGNVELDSERRTLVTRVRRIPHVEEVDNQIVLAPPAPLDSVLYARVSRRLQDAGYAQVTVRVHEGAVVLEGSVRTMRDRHSIVQLAWGTEGVKEVEANLSVMQPDAR